MKNAKILAAVLALSTVTTTAVATADQQHSVNVDQNKYSDRELIQGIVYGYGKVASELAITVQIPQTITADTYREAVEKSSNMLLTDRKFQEKTESALREIRSGNPRTVENGLATLGDNVQAQGNYLISKDDKAKRSIEGVRATPKCGVAVACVAYAALAVHNTVVVTALAGAVVGAAVVAATWKWKNKNSMTTQGNGREEQLVSELTALAQ